MREASLDPKRLTDGTIYATEARLSDYRADDPDPVPLLFQAGYLTIRSADVMVGEYTLAVPNGEVRYGLVESLLPAWAPGYGTARGTDVFTLRRLVEAGDVEGMRDIIMALFVNVKDFFLGRVGTFSPPSVSTFSSTLVSISFCLTVSTFF